jgi:hypothetical protein
MPTQNEIERRAYELYEQRGREDGHDRHDWFLAEAQLRRVEADAKSPAVTDLAGAVVPRRSRGERAQRPATS